MAKPRKRIPDKTRKQVLEELDLTDSDDELEELGKELARGGRRHAGSDEEEDEEEAVMDLSDDEDDDEEDDEFDEDEDGDEDAENDARLAKLAKQAKYLEQKLKLQEGVEGEDSEDEEGEDKQQPWSRRKADYYGADTANYEVDSDEEALKEEEEEVERLDAQRAAGLRPQDFDLSEDEEGTSESEGEEEDEPTMGALANGSKGGHEVEVVAKELHKMTQEERVAAVERDAPELLSLLNELEGALGEVRHRVAPLLQEVRDGEVATAAGVSYLEAKHLLLLQYCMSIVFYLLLKAEGRAVRDHPVVVRLVALRAYLEKIRPIDRKLQYQMDKLLKAAQVAQAEDLEVAGAAHTNDELAYGPRPDMLVTKGAAGKEGAEGDGVAGSTGDGIYRPPKLNPVSMDDDPDKPALNRDERRRLTEAKRRASRSALVRELVEEIEGAPEEQRAAAVGMESVAAIRQRQRLEARANVEEDLFMRVPLSREEVKKLKANRRAGLSGAAIMDDFGDEVDDIVELASAAAGGRSGLADLFARHRVSQRFGADPTALSTRPKSGDEDLPERMPLHERRARFDAVAARRAAAGAGGMSDGEEEYDYDNGDGGAGKRQREEDDFYTEAKEASRAKKQARRETYTRQVTLPPAEDPTAVGSRKISYEIEKNRGLTPHRRKDLKNPRKKHRVKFAKAVVRRKGQVQEVRKPSGGYGGEATGIKAKVAKSRRLG